MKAEKEKSQIQTYIDEVIDNYDFNKIIRDRWLKGLRPNGGIIGKYANGSGNVNLTDTGEMGRELQIFDVGRNIYAFGSGVEYYEKIADRYGLDNFNISNKDKYDLLDFIFIKVSEKYITNVYLI